MRRILAVLFGTIGAVVLAAVMLLWGMTSVNGLVREGTTTVSVAGDACVLGDTTARQWVEAIPETFGVEVSRTVWSDSSRVDVFASDMTFGGRLRLARGVWPQEGEDADTYVANADTASELQVGSFDLFAPGMQVLVHPFDALDHRDGYLGYLELHTTDAALVDQIVAYLADHVGPTARDSGAVADAASSIILWLVSNAFSAGMLLLLVVLTVFVLVRYAIRESRNTAILRLHGQGRLRVMGYYARGLAPCAAAGFGICALGVIVAAAALGSPFVVPALLLVDLGVNAALFVAGLLVLGAAATLQIARYGTASLVGGKKPFGALTAAQLVLKYVVLAVLLVGCAQIVPRIAFLEEQDAANDTWRQAQNVYHVTTKDAGQIAAEQSGDYATNRLWLHRGLDVFRQMEDEHGLILMYATNYADYGEGQKLWQANTGPDSFNKEDPWASINGTCVTVNENYLRRHPVVDVRGRDVRDLLARDDRTFDVLVPERYRAYEDEIEAGFRRGFWFEKVNVAQIYERRMGEPAPDLAEEDLAVNIVWVPDGLDWFTYDPAVMPETGNVVRDPLVVVDAHNVDASYYYAWMTSSCYYETNDTAPAAPLTQVALEHDAADAYNTVRAVFDFRADMVKFVEDGLRLTVAAEALLAVGAALCVYLFCSCWFVQHRRAVMVKRLHGFSMARIVGPMLATNVVLTAALALAWPGDIPLAVRIALPVLDGALTLAFGFVVQRAVVARALKGDA